jgi:hypothetical protein
MEKIQRDTDRDFFMTAEQAKEYRIVDEVIAARLATRPDPDKAVTAGHAKVPCYSQSQHDARKLIASPTVDICVEARRPIHQRLGTVPQSAYPALI